MQNFFFKSKSEKKQSTAYHRTKSIWPARFKIVSEKREQRAILLIYCLKKARLSVLLWGASRVHNWRYSPFFWPVRKNSPFLWLLLIWSWKCVLLLPYFGPLKGNISKLICSLLLSHKYPLRTKSPPHGFKAQRIGQCEKTSNQKQPTLFCFFVIGWCFFFDQSNGL